MTGHQIQCDESCPCRTSSCEETCPEYQFQERFSRWLAVQYSDLPLGAHQNIVLNASAIFDDINASNCGDESSHVPDSTELIAMANQEWKNREERRGIHNREDWCCGWMAGFLSENKPNWRQEQIVAAEKRGYERALEPHLQKYPGCNGICAFEPFEREAIAAEAINEQRIRVGKKLITGECFPNGDCGQCILCDNAGGCLAESSKQIQEAVKEAIRQERERIRKVVSELEEDCNARNY